MNAADALDLCDGILLDLDDLPERAEDFAESARELVEGIRDSVEEHGNVTERQETALENVRNGVDRWLQR